MTCPFSYYYIPCAEGSEHQQPATQDVKKKPPNMSQRCYSKKRSRTIAQPHRRRDAFRKSIALAQQQVNAGDESSHCRSTIKH